MSDEIETARNFETKARAEQPKARRGAIVQSFGLGSIRSKEDGTVGGEMVLRDLKDVR